MLKQLLSILMLLFCISCEEDVKNRVSSSTSNQYIVILGTAQDGGFPHIGCQRQCCTNFYEGIFRKQKVISLGLVDKEADMKFLFEATPDMTTQLDDLERNHLKSQRVIDGVFLTHAHIGHYAGLMYFGREALGKKDITVYAMPKMRAFLQNNGPWSQLVTLENIIFSHLKADSTVAITKSLDVTPFLVPHRDEFSETVGFKIKGKNRSALFIPDINKWQLWEKNIVEEVKQVDYAFLDATFLKDGEINRPMSEVPHPFIEETMQLFENESEELKNRVIFVHFNHTNPVLQPDSKERAFIEGKGFRAASEGDVYHM